MTEQPCCMCGKRTLTRCSSCAEYGFDIFFCSPNHQKLLWPVHRQVCGKGSNPFSWPPFSKEELEDVMKSRNDITHRSLEPEDRDRPLSVATRFKRDWNISERDLPDLLGSFRKGYKGSRIVSDETAQEMIFLIRTIQALRVGMKSGANASANPLENMMNMFMSQVGGNAPKSDPFDELSSYVNMYLPYPRYNGRDHSWWNNLLHKWLIVIHLTAISPMTTRDATPETPEIKRCGRYAAKEGLRYVEEVIMPVDPQAAKGPLKEFRQWNMEYTMG